MWILFFMFMMGVSAMTSSLPPPCKNLNASCKLMNNTEKAWMEDYEEFEEPSMSNLRLSRCFCDSGCRQFGDCCLDAVFDVEHSKSIQEIESELMTASTEGLRDWECHPLPTEKPAVVYMIGSCPSRYANAYIQNHCKRQVPTSEYDYTLDLPVVSKLTNITYVNVYCALCNSDAVLYEWSIVVSCPETFINCTSDTTSWHYVPGEWQWYYSPTGNESSNGENVITFKIQHPDAGNESVHEYHMMRNCHNIISKCPVDWLGNKEKTLCQAYSLIVGIVKTKSLYKNKFCAICNGESLDELFCPEPTLFIFFSTNVGSTHTHSYSFLMDFTGQGSQVGGVGNCGVDGLICGFEELCDQVFQTCRSYALSDLQNLNSRNCSDGADGPTFYVDRANFTRFQNESIFIESIQVMLKSDQYEVVNATTILVCVSSQTRALWKFSEAQSILSKVCVALSIICLAAHIVIYASIPPLLNLPGKNLLCLSVALFTAQLSFEFGVSSSTSHQLCVGISLTTHFGFLATFLWMNVIAVDIFRTLTGTVKLCSPDDSSSNCEFCVYSAYAWSVALALVLAAFANDATHWMPGFEPRYGDPLCWINNRDGLLAFFVLPLAVLLSANVILFSLTVAAICRTRKSAEVSRQSSTSTADDIGRIFLYVKLAVIMGLTWVFGFVAALANVEEIWYLYIVSNSLQGTFIFVAFSCKREVLGMLPPLPCSRICHSKCSDSRTSSESHTRSSLHTIFTRMSEGCATPD